MFTYSKHHNWYATNYIATIIHNTCIQIYKASSHSK